MPKVITNLPHLTSPGAWRKFFLLADRGKIPSLARQTRDSFDRFDLPRDYWVVLDASANWLRRDVPLFVVLALWLLRERQQADGSWFRRPSSGMAETGLAYRYVELALLAGEVWESDITLRRAAEWMKSNQLPDGGLPTFPLSDTAEIGTTARALRILATLDRPELREKLNDMAELLVQKTIMLDNKCAWGMIDSKGVAYPVSGATALTLLALLVYPGEDNNNVVPAGLTWLIEAQNPDGGWAETAGNPSKIDNTFYAIWALQFGAERGLVESQRVVATIGRARSWLNSLISGELRPTSVSEMAFMLRALTRIDGASTKSTLAWLTRLNLYAMDALHKESDLYGETELVAIALMEWVKALQAEGVAEVWQWVETEGQVAKWLWEMTPLPPHFLRQEMELRDFLYSITYNPFWLRIIDRLSDLDLPETVVGVLLGLFAVMGVLDDGVLRVLTLDNHTSWETSITMFCFSLNLVWLLVKLNARRHRLQRVAGYVISLLATALFFAYYSAATPLGSPIAFIRVVALYTLVTDVVGYTVDKSGLARHMLKSE